MCLCLLCLLLVLSLILLVDILISESTQLITSEFYFWGNGTALSHLLGRFGILRCWQCHRDANTPFVTASSPWKGFADPRSQRRCYPYSDAWIIDLLEKVSVLVILLSTHPLSFFSLQRLTDIWYGQNKLYSRVRLTIYWKNVID
jgi:hypothetical protein